MARRAPTVPVGCRCATRDRSGPAQASGTGNDAGDREGAERVRVAARLAETARLLDLSNDAIIVRDVNNRVTYWNRGAEELYGWSAAEAVGRDLHTLLRTEFELPLDQLMVRLRRADRMTGEVVQVTRGGRRVTLLCRWALDRDAAGNPASILTTTTDITDRKRAEERQAFLIRLSDALRPLGDPVAIEVEATRVLGAHLGVSRAFYCEAEPDGDHVRVHRDYTAAGVASFAGRIRISEFGPFWAEGYRAGRTLATGDTRGGAGAAAAALEAAGVRACVGVPVTKEGRLSGILVVHSAAPREWTPLEVALVEETAERTWAAVERARAEAALRDARDELEVRVAERTAELERALDALGAEMARRQDLARELATAQEDERRRVSRDLHDTVGQTLTGLGLAAAAGRADRVRELTDQLAREVHQVAVRLRPVALDDMGLDAALAELVRQWSAASGVPVELVSAGVGRLPAPVETAVYRVAQEALTNVARHARATRAGVSVTRTAGHVSVTVEDDGAGFDPGAARSGRLGLLGMRERVAQVGGALELESAPGRGTTVIARIPVGA